VNRHLAAPLAAAVVLAGLGTLPAYAAKAKPKPKPITGTYKVSLVPDPSINAQEGCGMVPLSQDEHPLALPAKGTLKVELAGGDVPGAGGGDWDLYTLDNGGNLMSASESDSVNEITIDKIKGKTSVSILVCNLLGSMDGTVKYTFAYA
jgi:hypothetical protein